MYTFEEKIVKEIYSDKFRELARRYTKDTKDLIQQTAYRALLCKDKFDGGNIGAWLFTILKNTFLNEFKQRKQRKTFSTEDAGYYSSAVVENEYEKKAEKDTLMKVVNSISKSGKEVINMDLAGYKTAEISKKISVPTGTVKSRLFHAKDDIKKIYTGKTRRKYHKNDLIYQIDKNTGAILNTFNNVLHASETLKTEDTNIYLALSGQRKTAAGYIWKRENTITA